MVFMSRWDRTSYRAARSRLRFTQHLLDTLKLVYKPSEPTAGIYTRVIVRFKNIQVSSRGEPCTKHIECWTGPTILPVTTCWSDSEQCHLNQAVKTGGRGESLGAGGPACRWNMRWNRKWTTMPRNTRPCARFVGPSSIMQARMGRVALFARLNSPSSLARVCSLNPRANHD